MRYRKTVLLGCAAILSLVSVAGHAMTRKEGLNACAEAVVGGLKNGEGTAPRFHLDTRSDLDGKRLGRRETVYLAAINPSNREVLARYDCLITGRGDVLELNELPLKAADAREFSYPLD